MSDNALPPGFGPDDPIAPDRAETTYADASFKITEFPPAVGSEASHPWIMVEIAEPGLPVLRHGDTFLGLVCRKGVTFEDAKRLADDLNRLVNEVLCTKFIT